MHNGYFYPQDIKITLVEGVRHAEVDFSLPFILDEDFLKVWSKCPLTAWEIGRRKYEDTQIDIWYRKTYPDYWEERERYKQLHKEGLSLSQIKTLTSA